LKVLRESLQKREDQARRYRLALSQGDVAQPVGLPGKASMELEDNLDNITYMFRPYSITPESRHRLTITSQDSYAPIGLNIIPDARFDSLGRLW
jgi:hypothetical protein